MSFRHKLHDSYSFFVSTHTVQSVLSINLSAQRFRGDVWSCFCKRQTSRYWSCENLRRPVKHANFYDCVRFLEGRSSSGWRTSCLDLRPGIFLCALLHIWLAQRVSNPSRLCADPANKLSDWDSSKHIMSKRCLLTIPLPPSHGYLLSSCSSC